jgi:hypothetical protein
MRLAFALLIFLGAASAQAQDDPPKPATAATPAGVSLQGYGNAEKTCLEWNDGCSTCRRGDAAVSCSNIGIACQPSPVVCTRRTDPPK